MVTFNCCYIKKKQVLISWKRNVFSKFTGLEKREKLNAWFILVVTLTKWARASTAFVLGCVQIIFTSARGQCFSGEN